MKIGFSYNGDMVYTFEAHSAEELRAGCLEGWVQLGIQEPPILMREGVLPQILLRNTRSRRSHRWVPGGFRFPGAGEGVMNAHHPLKDKNADWCAEWAKLCRGRADLATFWAAIDASDAMESIDED